VRASSTPTSASTRPSPRPRRRPCDQLADRAANRASGSGIWASVSTRRARRLELRLGERQRLRRLAGIEARQDLILLDLHAFFDENVRPCRDFEDTVAWRRAVTYPRR
jgi:hypothetical protein